MAEPDPKKLKEERDFSALSAAIERGDLKAVKALIEGGTDVNLKSGVLGETPLLVAANNSRYSSRPDADKAIIAYLLSKGAKVDEKDRLGRTALYHVPSKDLAVMLLDKLPPDARKKYIDESKALNTAAGDSALFDYYLSLGADVTVVGFSGYSWVCSCGDDFGLLQKRLEALTPELRTKVINTPGVLVGLLQDPDTVPASVEYIARQPGFAGLNTLGHDSLSPLDLLNQRIETLEKAGQAEKAAAYRGVRDKLVAVGAKTSDAIIREAAKNYTNLPDYLASNKIDDTEILPTNAPLDMAMFPSVPTLPPRDYKGPPVNLLVIEKQSPFDVDSAPGKKHIEETAYVARGVGQKLRGTGPQRVQTVPIYKHLNWEMMGVERMALIGSEAQGAHTVISYSMGEPESLPWFNYSAKDPARLARIQTPIFHAAGNDAEDKKGGLPGQDVQDDWRNHWPRVVKVGASRRQAKSKGTGQEVAPYSENGSIFTAPMVHIMRPGGEKELNGTSFAAPYAAAVFSELKARYGKWDGNPNGLTDEQIYFVMTETANPNLVDSKDGTIIPHVRRADGKYFSKRSGFGQLDPLKADDMANRLFEYQQANGLTAAPYGEKKYTLPAGTEVNGYHHYAITLDEPVLVDNMFLDVRFRLDPPQANGLPANAARLVDAFIEHEGVNIPLNFAPDGTSTVAGLSGMHLPAGTKLVLKTQAPLQDGALTVRGGQGGPDNPIMRFMEETKGRLPPLDPIIEEALLKAKKEKKPDELPPVPQPQPVRPAAPPPPSGSGTPWGMLIGGGLGAVLGLVLGGGFNMQGLLIAAVAGVAGAFGGRWLQQYMEKPDATVSPPPPPDAVKVISQKKEAGNMYSAQIEVQGKPPLQIAGPVDSSRSEMRVETVKGNDGVERRLKEPKLIQLHGGLIHIGDPATRRTLLEIARAYNDPAKITRSEADVSMNDFSNGFVPDPNLPLIPAGQRQGIAPLP